MNRSVGATLRRAAGGSVIFALGFGAISSAPQSFVRASASTPTSPAAQSLPATGWAMGIDPAPDPHIRTITFASPTAASMPVAPMAAATTAPVRATSRAAVAAYRPSSSNTGGRFAYGYCTWWVAQKRSIPWQGNAAQWWWNARAYGFAEGSTPRPGAIMVMGAGGAASPEGHVAYVESVNANGSFVVSEMNWWGVPGGGWGRVDYRTVTSMRGILGFIY